MFGIFKSMLAPTDNGDLKEALKSGAFLVDVRTPAEFSAGTVKGAVNIPLSQLPNQLSQFKGKKRIVVFCRSGSRSGQAKRLLERHGFPHVINGGRWQNVNQAINEP